ncbi:MAG: hypothetical protein Kow0099_22180 [Candidatus Abyssubacteria bacterium]
MGGMKMRFLISLMMLMLFPALAVASSARPSLSGPLDVIKFKDSSYEMVGEIVEEYDDSVVIIPENGGRIKLKREFIDEIKYDARPPRQVETKELVADFTQCVAQMVTRERPFRVVKVTPQEVYLNLGLPEGARPGLEFNIYREGDAILDSETGRILGREKERIGIVQIIDVEKNYSKAVPVEMSVTEFREGDTGLFLRESPILAVAGITTLEGEESPYGSLLSEQIVSGLKEYPGTKVVERRQLGQILRELAIQNALLGPSTSPDVAFGRPRQPASVKSLQMGADEEPLIIDDSMAQKLRKLQGADALIVGTVANVNGHGAVNLRVVDTHTAAVLYSTHRIVGKPEKPVREATLQEPLVQEPPPKEPKPKEVGTSAESTAEVLDRILRAVYQR